MSNSNYPGKRDLSWPRPGSFSYALARFLVGSAPRHAGQVPYTAFMLDHPGIPQRRLYSELQYLRSRFHYYCRIRGNNIECCMVWPTFRIDKRYNYRTGGHDLVPVPVANVDSRLQKPLKDHKFTIPDETNGPLLADCYNTALNKRDPDTGLFDAKPLYRKYGTMTVYNKFKALNKGNYGVKLTTAGGDGIWRIEKERNVKLSKEVLDAREAASRKKKEDTAARKRAKTAQKRDDRRRDRAFARMRREEGQLDD